MIGRNMVLPPERIPIAVKQDIATRGIYTETYPVRTSGAAETTLGGTSILAIREAMLDILERELKAAARRVLIAAATPHIMDLPMMMTGTMTRRRGRMTTQMRMRTTRKSTIARVTVVRVTKMRTNMTRNNPMRIDTMVARMATRGKLLG
jgi:hypothetical protein